MVGEILLWNVAAVAGLMVVVWLISLPIRDVSIVDVAWGLGFVALAWLTFVLTAQRDARSMIIVLCTTIWGLRLSAWLALRNLGKPEDFRYREMRERHGPVFPLISLPLVFGLQGAVMWVVSLPVQAGQVYSGTTGLSWLDALGVTVWLAGLLFEAIGDYQLARFKARPENAGQVFDRGLWRYTRHPNYFGDFLVWWGLYLIALATGAAWWSVVSPIVMSVFLMRISGVTLLEKSLEERKPGFREYARRTNAFFPWPPRGMTEPRRESSA